MVDVYFKYSPGGGGGDVERSVQLYESSYLNNFQNERAGGGGLSRSAKAVSGVGEVSVMSTIDVRAERLVETMAAFKPSANIAMISSLVNSFAGVWGIFDRGFHADFQAVGESSGSKK